MVYPLFGKEIALLIVAVAFQAARHEDPVGPVLESLSRWIDVHRSGAGHLHDPHVRRILNRIEPARSAAEYAQYVQQKPMIIGSNCSIALLLLGASLHSHSKTSWRHQ